MKSLPALMEDSYRLTKCIVEAEGEITPELELELKQLQADVQTKLDNYHFICERLAHEALLWDAKAKYYSKIAKSLKRSEEFLETLVKNHLVMTDSQRIEGEEATWSLVKSQPKVNIADESRLPDVFLRIHKEPNKVLIKDALESGQDVPGCTLERGFSIRHKERPKSLKEKV